MGLTNYINMSTVVKLYNSAPKGLTVFKTEICITILVDIYQILLLLRFSKGFIHGRMSKRI